MKHARITGTGSALPARILTNHDLEALVDTSDEWIRERTGIVKRHIAGPEESTASLAEAAARRALDMAGRRAEAVDLIVVATTTPDQIFPSTACLLQARLGVRECPAFDVQAVCTGFIYALGVAEKFVATGAARCALVVGSETLSRIVDWTDRGTCVLFGDGAGAVVLEAGSEPGILSTHLHADGRHREALMVPGGIGQAHVVNGEQHNGASLPSMTIAMRGNEVFRMAVQTLDRIVDETLAHNRLEKSAIDWLVPHQANIRIISATAKKLRLPMERVVVTVDQHGNTSAASIPLALDVAVRDGRLQPGQLLLMEAFGGGFTWGSALLRL